MNTFKNILVLHFLVLFTVSLAAQSINTAQSIVNFKIGSMGFGSTKGTFTGMEGKVSFTPKDPNNAIFDVCIDAATVDTGNEKRDNHLKNEDFFDVEKYPTICFTSEEITETVDGYTTVGTLEMHGVKKTVEIPFTFDGSQLTGELTINRRDYEVGPRGGFMVGKQVKIEITCVLE